jgi:hypothetical protein
MAHSRNRNRYRNRRHGISIHDIDETGCAIVSRAELGAIEQALPQILRAVQDDKELLKFARRIWDCFGNPLWKPRPRELQLMRQLYDERNPFGEEDPPYVED